LVVTIRHFFFSLPPPLLPHSDFMKSLATARKSLIRSWKLSRRSTMTRPWWECSYMRLSKGKIWERATAAADQKNLTATVSIAYIAVKVENDHQEIVMKLAQAHDVSVETVHATLHKDLPLLGSWPAERSNCFTRRWRRSLGDHSDNRHSFLTISDNVLNVDWSAGCKKQASWHQPQSGGLPVGAGGGTKNGAATNFAKAFWQ
jgi:hypothetical protein